MKSLLVAHSFLDISPSDEFQMLLTSNNASSASKLASLYQFLRSWAAIGKVSGIFAHSSVVPTSLRQYLFDRELLATDLLAARAAAAFFVQAFSTILSNESLDMFPGMTVGDGQTSHCFGQYLRARKSEKSLAPASRSDGKRHQATDPESRAQSIASGLTFDGHRYLLWALGAPRGHSVLCHRDARDSCRRAKLSSGLLSSTDVVWLCLSCILFVLCRIMSSNCKHFMQ